MKKAIFIAMFAAAFVLSIPATSIAQNASTGEKVSGSAMNASGHMGTMMDEIAGSKQMRRQMMKKMITRAKGDTSSMMEMCMTMMNDKDMGKMMQKMMSDSKKMDCGMMKGMMSDSKKMDCGMMGKDVKKQDHSNHMKKK
ncbi:MAG: hypothetical protein GXO82_08355 [Chlorobi bacterium]|nr:hypothetical protein [Chlorobiota bacterium]